MRSWFIAAIAALAIGMIVPADVQAVPAGDQMTLGGAAAGSSSLQEARYVVRCHSVRVWRHGRPVWVRRCHRVWRNR